MGSQREKIDSVYFIFTALYQRALIVPFMMVGVKLMWRSGDKGGIRQDGELLGPFKHRTIAIYSLSRYGAPCLCSALAARCTLHGTRESRPFGTAKFAKDQIQTRTKIHNGTPQSGGD